MKKLMSNVCLYIMRALRSFLKFASVSVLISCFVALCLTLLWQNGLLGEDCRYYGSYVEKCSFAGIGVDGLAKIYLTAWILPVVGIIAGFIMPIAIGVMFAVFVWPVYFLVLRVPLSYAFKMIVRAFSKLLGRS